MREAVMLVSGVRRTGQKQSPEEKVSMSGLPRSASSM